MKKEIDYRFDKDGQIVRIENKLSPPLSKELPKEPTEEIHSFKSSKYFLAILKTIDNICFLAMLVKYMTFFIHLPIDFILNMHTHKVNFYILQETLRLAMEDMLFNTDLLPITFATIFSCSCDKKDDICYQGIFFWLNYHIAKMISLLLTNA